MSALPSSGRKYGEAQSRVTYLPPHCQPASSFRFRRRIDLRHATEVDATKKTEGAVPFVEPKRRSSSADRQKYLHGCILHGQHVPWCGSRQGVVVMTGATAPTRNSWNGNGASTGKGAGTKSAKDRSGLWRQPLACARPINSTLKSH